MNIVRAADAVKIGGTIGTYLLLGTRKSLATGGPASTLIAYVIVGANCLLITKSDLAPITAGKRGHG